MIVLRIQVYFPGEKMSYDREEKIAFPLDDDEVRRMAEGIKAKNPSCSRILITEVGKVRFDTAKLI